MAPSRVSTTRFEWLPDDPTAFAPSRLWKSPSIPTWGDSRNQNPPIDSAEEGENRRRSRIGIYRVVAHQLKQPISQAHRHLQSASGTLAGEDLEMVSSLVGKAFRTASSSSLFADMAEGRPLH